MTFAEFILQHEGDDPVRLLLSRSKYPDVDLDLAVTTLEVRRKLKTKVPEWYSVPSLVYPFRLSGEQCSSSETARYKAQLTFGIWQEDALLRADSWRSSERPAEAVSEGLIGREPQGDNRGAEPPSKRGRSEAEAVSEGVSSHRRIADLTGGMGVDAWAFAQVAEEVLYNEMNGELEKATELNFRELGVDNVRFRNCLVEPGKVKEVLDGFQPEAIYLDPARRTGDGRKVFLIEECQPDVLGLLPELFEASRFVLLKLSPMADVTMACKRLGNQVRQVHVVASGGECKELLLQLEREWSGGYTLTAYENGHTLSWTPEEEASAAPVLPSSADFSGLLYEPGKALSKAGAFNLPCARYGLTKLGHHTHLYTGEAVPEELWPLGKVFEILEVMPLSNRTLKEVGKRFPQAEVTARNIPMTSDQFRKKLGCASGGDVHLFGVRVDAASGAGNYLIVTRPMHA